MRIERRSHIGYKIQDGVKSPYSKGISSILFEFEINDPLLKSIEFDELMIAIRKVRRKAIDEYKNK